jgi:hypothetical protein
VKGEYYPVKYHENIHGEMVECRADERPCYKQHVTADNLEEAQRRHEEVLAQEYGEIPNTTPKPPKPSPAMFAQRRATVQQAISKTVKAYRRDGTQVTPPRGRYRGSVKTGQVKRTRGQIKKHYTQMSEGEVALIRETLARIDTERLQKSFHLREKEEREGLTVPMGLIRSTLQQPGSALIIEYNRNERTGEARVLVRTKRVRDVVINGESRRCQLCFVVSPVLGRVQTAYWNVASDRHRYLDMTRYDEGLQVTF